MTASRRLRGLSFAGVAILVVCATYVVSAIEDRGQGDRKRASLQAAPAARTAEPGNEPHLHHVHYNVVDPKRTADFYREFFGALAIKYGGADALMLGRTFMLLNKVSTAPASEVDTGLWHLGFGTSDLPAEYVHLKSKGVQFARPLIVDSATVDPHGNASRLISWPLDPDRLVLELLQSPADRNRFNHIHLIAKDPEATLRWYGDMLGAELRLPATPPPPPATAGNPPRVVIGRHVGVVVFDGIALVAYEQPSGDPPPMLWGDKPLKVIQPTKGRTFDHIAFSVRRLQPVFERMQKAGVQIVEPIALRSEYGFRSFFVMGPDQVLVEVVEAQPLSDGVWGTPPRTN